VHARAYTHTDTPKCLTVALHLNQHTPSLCCCQIKEWKAGHKGECAAAALAGSRQRLFTADQGRVLPCGLEAGQVCVLWRLTEAAAAADWRGVAALERAGRELAAAIRTAMPDVASKVYLALRDAYQGLGPFPRRSSNSDVYIRQALAKEVGNAWR
jgi:hypothetical protein